MKSEVEVIKTKKGVATVIRYNGQRYAIQHPTHIRANQNIKKEAGKK